jgi:hypothetical protein
LAWLEQFKFNKSLTGAFPLIVLAEQPIEIAPFAVRLMVPTGNAFSGPPAVFNVGNYKALRLRVGNKPQINTNKAYTRINAKISFFNERGARLVVMDGRWAESPQLTERNAAEDYVESLAAPFPIGAERSLDLVLQRPGENYCVAVNNDNFRNNRQDLGMPGRDLSGIVRVLVELNGPNVKTRVVFKFSCSDMSPIGEVEIKDEMPRL